MIRLYRLSTGEDVIGTPVDGDPLNEGDNVDHITFEYIKKPKGLQKYSTYFN